MRLVRFSLIEIAFPLQLIDDEAIPNYFQSICKYHGCLGTYIKRMLDYLMDDI